MNLRKLFIDFSTRHDLYYRIFIIIGSILIITSYLPNQLRFKYEFTEGGIWNYEDLKAPFNFTIYKPEGELDAEKREIMQEQIPCFRIDTTVEAKSLRTYIKNYDVPSATSEAGLNVIRSIYKKGLLEEGSAIPSTEIIFLLSGNKAQEIDKEDVLIAETLSPFIEVELKASGVVYDDHLIDEIEDAVKPNLKYDETLSAASLQEKLSAISLTRGVVSKGTLLARKGTLITREDATKIESLRIAFEERHPDSASGIFSYAGYILLVSIAIGVLVIFLWLLRKDILLDNRKLTLLFLLIVGITLMFTAILQRSWISLLVVPLCILPLVTRAFFDTRTALFAHVLTTLILGTVAPNGFEFVFMQIIAGMVAIFSIVNLRRRAQLFVAVAFILISYLVSYAGLSLINEGNISEIKLSSIGWLGGNVLLTLLTYPLIFFIEKTFGVTSDFTLIELTDFNNALLREMSLKAPGTFQHSLQVANLAEAAIYKIGGNSLLVRVGALYHDIGKIDMPLYFIENQSTQMNPHDELSFDESAAIIISHVVRGIERARKNNLPDAVIDFIRTHHGTMMVQYFYQNYLKNYPDKIPNEDDFRYPGPKPFSRETAVLMMADSVEAAARSLTVHDSESIDKLVEKIIHHQINSDQFENCDITYRDITAIKKMFKKMLSSIYHVRVAYPSGS